MTYDRIFSTSNFQEVILDLILVHISYGGEVFYLVLKEYIFRYYIYKVGCVVGLSAETFYFSLIWF